MNDEHIALNAEADFSPGERRILSVTPSGMALTTHLPLAQNSQKPKGDILLLPGWSGPRTGPAEILVYLASQLAAHGWVARRVDLPGRGDNFEKIDAELDAMIDCAARAAALSAAPRQHVALGICSGGNVALGAAALKHGPKFDRVVAISTLPFQPARTKTFDQRRRSANLKRYVKKAFSPSTWTRLLKGEINTGRVLKNVSAQDRTAGKNLKDSARDIERELRDWRGRALFVWGGGDEEAAPARTHFERLHQAGLGEKGRVTFHTVAGANHNFYGRAWREELLKKILAFLDE